MGRPVSQRQMLIWVVVVVAIVALAVLTATADEGPRRSRDVWNCQDFGNQMTAVAVYDADPSDPNHLDGKDKDGRPCESLP
jgi:hypothetical protein